jgi:hypothetical protein
VAKRHGLSPGRISQLRRAFHDGWAAFCDLPDAKAPSGPGTCPKEAP